jgi:uncharacterized protein YjbJ (UPF0337 family)
MANVTGKPDRLHQERYGISKEQAEREDDDWASRS